jgi:NDP-sugar pyrophosphorylase family protein
MAQCVILAGGLGTRMRPLTDSCPKTLLPVRGRPFAYHQLHWLASQGITEVVYSIGHQGDLIRRYWDRAPGRLQRFATLTKGRSCAAPLARCGWLASKAYSTSSSS